MSTHGVQFRTPGASVWSWGNANVGRPGFNPNAPVSKSPLAKAAGAAGNWFANALAPKDPSWYIQPTQGAPAPVAQNPMNFGRVMYPMASATGQIGFGRGAFSPVSPSIPTVGSTAGGLGGARWAADSAVATGTTIYDQIRRGEIPSQPPQSIEGSIGQVSNNILNANYANMMAQQDQMGLQARQHDINMQELALREALLNGDIDRAKQLIADINANKAALNQAYQNYYAFTLPHNQQAVASAGQIADNQIGAMNQIAAGEVGDKLGAYNQAEHNVVRTADMIGAGDAAAQAALQAVGRDADLHYGAALERSHFANRLLQGEENVAVTGAREAWATDYWQKSMQNQLDDAAMLVKGKAAQDQLRNLENERAFLDLDRQRANLANEIAMKQISLSGEIIPVSAVDFAIASAGTSITDAIAKAGLDPQVGIYFQSLMQQIMGEGNYNSADVEKWLNTVIDEETGQTRRMVAGQGGKALTATEEQILKTAFNTYETAYKQYQSGAAFEEYTSGTFKTVQITANSVFATKGVGEAGKNAVPDSQKYPGYEQRAAYAAEVGRQIVAAYPGVTIGQWRGKDQGSNPDSDHKSGGALDIHGDHATLMMIAKNALTWPNVSFIKYGDDAAHKDHIHISFDIGMFGGS